MNGNNVVILQKPDGCWLLFKDPVDVLRTEDAGKVCGVLEQVEKAVEKGLSAAGFLAYEAAPAFDKALKTHKLSGVPLAWFGLYRSVTELDELPPPKGAFEVGKWQMAISESEYNNAIAQIRKYIFAGDTYQVNFTTRLRASFAGDAYALFHSLWRAQRAKNCAFVNFDDYSICSASPELFFEVDGSNVVSRPMKGTISRGLTCDDDAANAKALKESGKNRAENVMIVDMIRNDLGRVAEAGSVRVTSEFDIERYPTVLQMTSTVEATTAASVTEIMTALFPCASVTGAPKVRTMEIIAELESESRGVYCGAIGCIMPGRKARFNVAIRTVVVNRKSGSAEYGVGGGIVWESAAAEEYKECLTKASVLTAELPEFELLETMLWTPEQGYFLLDKHLCRLARSAEYFGFEFDEETVAEKLIEKSAGMNLLEGAAPSAPEGFDGAKPSKNHDVSSRQYRVRLLLSRGGKITLESTPLVDTAQKPFRVAIAIEPVNSQNIFLYHKTTNRGVYETAKQPRPDCDDVILFNERGEVTESTIANVVVEIGGRKITPPVKCGLLAGAYREYLLDRGEIEEGIVTVAELKKADRIYLINSVRTWMKSVLI